MSSSLKLSLLALVSTAAAIPHYGHSRFHKPSSGYGTGTGAPYPTGGWPGANSTGIYQPTGTGVSDEKTTTYDETITSTTTLVSTILLNPSPSGYPSGGEEPSSAVPADVVSTTADDAKCGGPETIYVTATNQVTVTVTAGDVTPSSSSTAVEVVPSSSSSAAEVASSSSAAPTGGYEAPVVSSVVSYVLPSSSSSAVEEKVSVSIPHKGVETPSSTPANYAPVTSEAAAPSSSVVEEKSSAAPSATPSSSPSYSGGKRGLAYNDASLCSKFSGMSWAYSWGSAPGGKLPEGVNFIPMAWVKNEDASTWLKKVDEAVASGSNAVMGFNEVDHPAQSNMLPDTACQKWKDYMNPIASAHPDVTIIGPSVTNAGDKPNWGLDWYKNFMSVCPDAQWHAANIHFYDVYQEGEGDSSTVNRFQKHIENAAKLTGKKVWVTEFGLNVGSSKEDTTKFVKAAMKYMDESPDVQGYSYFMVGTGPNQLVAGDGLSEIGQVYAASTY